MTIRLQIRRDTSSGWMSSNPILALGEPGLETDTNKLKFGDGITVWTSLSYFGGGGSNSLASLSDYPATSDLRYARASASAAKGANSDITSLSGLTTPLSLGQGGTAGIDAPSARAALGFGPMLSAADFGAVGDFNIPGVIITVNSASLTGTVNSLPSGLRVGHTLIVQGVNNLIVQAISGTSITFTALPSASATSVRFAFGTDNTVALNNWFTALLTGGLNGWWGNGKFLVTGTVGRLDAATTADSLGVGGPTIYCGGAESQSCTFPYMQARAGTSLVWGGAASTPMMQFSRVLHPHFIGGIALCGQPASQSGGTVTTWGNRCGPLFEMSQNSTPWIGTGYGLFDDLVIENCTLGVQFGENLSDNNCDTTRINRYKATNCDQVMLIANQQGSGYSIGFAHHINCTRGIVSMGGAITIEAWFISACNGTASGYYQLECSGTSSFVGYDIGLMRSESTSANLILVGTNANVTIANYQDNGSGGANINLTLFQVTGNGVLKFGVYNSPTSDVTNRPIKMVSVAGLSPKVDIDFMQVAVPSLASMPLLSYFFDYDANTVVDITVRKILGLGGPATLNPINTKISRGAVYLYGQTTTTTATTLVLIFGRFFGLQVYGFSLRVPTGLSVINVTVACYRSDGGYSLFQRQVVILRDLTSTGTATVLSVTTVGTDVATGTDTLSSITVDATTEIFHIQVGGSTGITGNWQATCILAGGTPQTGI